MGRGLLVLPAIIGEVGKTIVAAARIASADDDDVG